MMRSITHAPMSLDDVLALVGVRELIVSRMAPIAVAALARASRSLRVAIQATDVEFDAAYCAHAKPTRDEFLDFLRYDLATRIARRHTMSVVNYSWFASRMNNAATDVLVVVQLTLAGSSRVAVVGVYVMSLSDVTGATCLYEVIGRSPLTTDTLVQTITEHMTHARARCSTFDFGVASLMPYDHRSGTSQLHLGSDAHAFILERRSRLRQCTSLQRAPHRGQMATAAGDLVVRSTLHFMRRLTNHALRNHHMVLQMTLNSLHDKLHEYCTPSE